VNESTGARVYMLIMGNLEGGVFTLISECLAGFWAVLRCAETPQDRVGAQANSGAGLGGAVTISLALRTRLQAATTYWPWAWVRCPPR
jgi:hypothetical protein